MKLVSFPYVVSDSGKICSSLMFSTEVKMELKVFKKSELNQMLWKV
jgi:hypothetical protein